MSSDIENPHLPGPRWSEINDPEFSEARRALVATAALTGGTLLLETIANTTDSLAAAISLVQDGLLALDEQDPSRVRLTEAGAWTGTPETIHTV